MLFSLAMKMGVAEAANELGVKHLPNVKCTESGTPLISSMFQLARENSDSESTLHHQRGHDPDARFRRSGKASCKVKGKICLA